MAIQRSVCLAAAVGVLGTLMGGTALAQEGFQPLFNGKNLSGWVAVFPDKDTPAAGTWMVKDGVLVCTGKPNGYLRTEKEYDNFILKLEWRYPRPSDLKEEAAFKGNSGVLLFALAPDKVWPKSVEVQLANASAGSIFAISSAKAANRVNLKGKARPVGDWNSFEITCKNGDVALVFNGENVGTLNAADVKKGYIGLQSEGTEIHFRNLQIKELK